MIPDNRCPLALAVTSVKLVPTPDRAVVLRRHGYRSFDLICIASGALSDWSSGLRSQHIFDPRVAAGIDLRAIDDDYLGARASVPWM